MNVAEQDARVQPPWTVQLTCWVWAAPGPRWPVSGCLRETREADRAATAAVDCPGPPGQAGPFQDGGAVAGGQGLPHQGIDACSTARRAGGRGWRGHARPHREPAAARDGHHVPVVGVRLSTATMTAVASGTGSCTAFGGAVPAAACGYGNFTSGVRAPPPVRIAERRTEQIAANSMPASVVPQRSGLRNVSTAVARTWCLRASTASP